MEQRTTPATRGAMLDGNVTLRTMSIGTTTDTFISAPKTIAVIATSFCLALYFIAGVLSYKASREILGL